MYDNQVLLPGHFKGARIPGEAILAAQRRRHKLVWLHDRCLRGRTHATITVPDISTPPKNTLWPCNGTAYERSPNQDLKGFMVFKVD